MEEADVGIVTNSFEQEKFREVAEKLEKMVTDDKEEIPSLISFKLKNNLRAYTTEIVTLYNFADKKILIGEKMYELNVFLLQKISETDYEATIKIAN